MADYDGRLKFDTGISTAGFVKGIENIGSLAKKGISSMASLAKSGVQGIVSLSSSCAETVGKAANLANDAVRKSIDITKDSMKKLGEEALNLSKSAIEVGKSFESSMSQVIATMGVTKDSMTEVVNADGTTSIVNAYDMLSEKAKEMGATTQFSASEAADALNYLALAGYDAQKSCDALPAVLNLAAAGGMELGRASDLATDAMAALGMEATTENLTHFGDSLAKTASRSNTSVEQLGEAILVCGGQAKLAGLDLTEMNTMLGILADNGIKGSEGGTALRNVLKNIYTPTSTAAKAIEALGISTSDADGNLRDIQDILIDTMSALENLSEADKMQAIGDIFDTRTIAAASATLNNSKERFNELSAEIENCDGAMAQMAETMNDNFEGDIKIWESALEGFGISFYESITDNLRKTVQEATGWISHLDTMFKFDGLNGLAAGISDVFKQIIQEAYTEIPKALSVGNSFIETLCDGILNSTPQIRALGSRILIDLAESFAQNFNKFYETGLIITDSLLEGFANNSDMISNSVSEFIFTIGSNLDTYLPNMFDSGAKILTSLLKGLSKILPNIAGMIKETVGKFLKTIKASLPEVLKAGQEVIDELISGTSSGESKIGSLAVEIISELSKFILYNVPLLLDAGLNVLENILQGAVDGFNQIMPFVTDFISQICNVITEHLPKLLEIGLDIIMSLVNGITDNIPVLVGTAVDIILALAQFLSENAELIIDSAIEIITTLCDELLTAENIKLIINAAIDIILALAKGISDNLPKLIECATNILQELGNYLNNPANQTELVHDAGEIVGAIVKGMLDSLEPLAEFVGGVFVELGRLIFATDWSKLGDEITNGIMSGMLDIDFDCQEFGENFKENWISGFKDIFQIHSPSKLMRDEIGVYIVPGIAEGIEDTSEQLTNEMNDVADDMINNIDTDKFVDFDIKSKVLTDFSAVEQLSTKMENAVAEQQLKYSPALNFKSELDVSSAIKSGIENAFKDLKLDNDTNITVKIGQETIENIMITALDKYNARTGGRY